MDVLLRKGRGTEMRMKKRIHMEGRKVAEVQPDAEMIQERGACET